MGGNQYLKVADIALSVPELTKVFGDDIKGVTTERQYCRVYVKGEVVNKYNRFT